MNMMMSQWPPVRMKQLQISVHCLPRNYIVIRW